MLQKGRSTYLYVHAVANMRLQVDAMCDGAMLTFLFPLLSDLASSILERKALQFIYVCITFDR